MTILELEKRIARARLKHQLKLKKDLAIAKAEGQNHESYYDKGNPK